ncbi:hypothetical protein H8D36_07485 [archaeon]|nr:hypothetical protein [archaeon]MBL7057624.1 hypothetical protein [Candidatus Woesearchaeota archaeon]
MNIQEINDVDLKLIDRNGVDSIVYRFKNSVLKAYTILSNQIGLEQTFRIIEQYRQDTLVAIASQPTIIRPTIVEGVSYEVVPIIVPPGRTDYWRSENIVCSLGQEFIEGKNLAELSDDNSANKQINIDPDFPSTIASLVGFDILMSLWEYEQTINREVGSKFHITPDNVKFKCGIQDKTIFTYITDLADNLQRIYIK